jgi:hypothetical protein
MIEIVNGLLEKVEFDFLNKNLTNNINDFPMVPNKKNFWYYKKIITPDEHKSYLLNYYSKLSQHINSAIFDINNITINFSTVDTNNSDIFHMDECDRTVITYLNDDFTGGEFEYILNDKLFKIKPEVNLTIILNSKIKHRILPTTSGYRYSLVTFYKVKTTEKNKLF